MCGTFIFLVVVLFIQSHLVFFIEEESVFDHFYIYGTVFCNLAVPANTVHQLQYGTSMGLK